MTAFVITAVDTGICKTVCSAARAGATGASDWKPIQSGLEDETDRETVHKLLPARSVGRGTAAQFLPAAKTWGGGPAATRRGEGPAPPAPGSSLAASRAPPPPPSPPGGTAPPRTRREPRGEGPRWSMPMHAGGYGTPK